MLSFFFGPKHEDDSLYILHTSYIIFRNMLLVEVDFIPYQHRIEYKEKEDMPNGSSLSTLDFGLCSDCFSIPLKYITFQKESYLIDSRWIFPITPCFSLRVHT